MIFICIKLKMNFRFKKKQKPLSSSRYNLGLVRILIVFIFLTFFVTIYLYDLLDVNSKNLFIRILSPDIEEVDNSESSVEMIRNDWKVFRPNNRHTVIENNDNITRMFLKIDRFNLIIKSPISPSGIISINNLKKDTSKKVSGNFSLDEQNDKFSEKLSTINKTISRDTLVKILKYEKILLNKKFKEKKIQTIGNLLFEYISNNGIEKE